MNKGRSKLFSERMKGVFKSRSHGTKSSKSSESLESANKLESEKIGYRNGFIFYPPSSTVTPPSSNSGSLFHNESHPDGSKPNSYPGNMTAKITDVGNDRLGIEKENLYKNANDRASGSNDDELSSFNELRIKNNNINDSCQLCLSDLDINQNSSKVINNRNTWSPKRRPDEDKSLNNNNNNNFNTSSLRYPKSFRSDKGMCHFCLKQICVCGNNNMLLDKEMLLNTALCCKPNDSFRFSKVLQYAFGKERNDRNDFIILALGIQHYIKEVFNALDYNNNGYVYQEDLRILCKILGKDLDNKSKFDDVALCDTESSEKQVCANNSCKMHLHFGKFSEIICNTFSGISDRNCLEKRNNTQLVNAVVSVTRRSQSLSVISKQLEELEKDYLDFKTTSKYFTLPNINKSVKNCKNCTKYQLMEGKNNTNNIHLENLKLQKIILLQQQELQCLREVIEDLRVSLQCSDAENLSLRVREIKSHQRTISDDEMSKIFLSSTDDENDSIDRIILDFPSNEKLDLSDLSSSESLLTMRSFGSVSPKRPLSPVKSTQIDYEKNATLTNRIMERMNTDEEDICLNNEIQHIYQQLSETKSELEDTRSDLESTVSEIQIKNKEINRLARNLSDMKVNFDKFLIENSNLKEKIIELKSDKKLHMEKEILRKELEGVKSDLAAKNEEIAALSKQLELMRLKRKRDLHQLSTARSLVAKSLVEMQQKEMFFNKYLETNKDTIPKIDYAPSAILEIRPQNSINLTTNNNNNNSRLKKSHVNPKKSHYFDRNEFLVNKKDFHHIPMCNDTNVTFCEKRIADCHYDPQNDFKLSSENHAKIAVPPSLNPLSCDARKSVFNGNKALFKRTNHGQKTDFRNTEEVPDEAPPVATLLRERSSTLGIISPEDKPTLEVKPNLTKPIRIMPPFFNTDLYSTNEELKSNLTPGPDTYITSSFNPDLSFKSKPTFWDNQREAGKPNCQTSAQILDGLEAEVESLMKSLETDQGYS